MRVPGYSPCRADGIIRTPKPNEETPVKVREIDEQLALENENLSVAKEASKRAIAASLKDRNNPNLRANVAISDGEVKSIEAVIADLQEQRNAAVLEANSDAAKALVAQREALSQKLANSKKTDFRNAQKLDKAMAALFAAAKVFAEGRNETSLLIGKYLDLCEHEVEDKIHHAEVLGGADARYVSHAIGLGFYRVALALKLSQLSDFVSFNHYTLENPVGTGGDYDRTAARGVAFGLDLFVSTIGHIEAIHGDDYVRPAIAPVIPQKSIQADHAIVSNWAELMELVKSTEAEPNPMQAETHTVARDWNEYLASTAGLESPAVLNEE